MPIKDKDKNRLYQRRWQRKKKTLLTPEQKKKALAQKRKVNAKYRSSKKGKASYKKRIKTGMAARSNKKYANTLRGKIMIRAQKDRSRYGDFAEVAYLTRTLSRRISSDKKDTGT